MYRACPIFAESEASLCEAGEVLVAHAQRGGRGRPIVAERSAGYRTVPHTADVRVEAWAPSREECIAQAVLGAVNGFLDTSAARPVRTHHCQLRGDTDEDLLVAVVDEVIFRLDTDNEAPIAVDLTPTDAGLDARMTMCNAAEVPQIGAIPKAVSLHGLLIDAGPDGWRCSITVDV